MIDAPGECDLVVPHPRMAFRSFVLRPANEVAPQMRHPVIGWTIARLWQHLQTCPPLVAFALRDQVRANQMLERLEIQGKGSRLSQLAFPASMPSLAGSIAWLWASANESIPQEAPVRPILTICDSSTAAGVTGPTIDVSDMSDGEAETEIAAAIDAVRE